MKKIVLATLLFFLYLPSLSASWTADFNIGYSRLGISGIGFNGLAFGGSFGYSFLTKNEGFFRGIDTVVIADLSRNYISGSDYSFFNLFIGPGVVANFPYSFFRLGVGLFDISLESTVAKVGNVIYVNQLAQDIKFCVKLGAGFRYEINEKIQTGLLLDLGLIKGASYLLTVAPFLKFSFASFM